MGRLSAQRIHDIVKAIGATRVMVIGDVMLDRYVWGLVSRISPEAPVPVVDVREETSRLGGAANVANNVVSLGASCQLVGVVGDDSTGRELQHKVQGLGMTTSGLVIDCKRPTTVKMRIVAHDQQVVRADRESREEIDGEVQEALYRKVMDGLARCDAVIISDYGKGVITKHLLDSLIPEARSTGKTVSVDPKETHFKNYRKVSLITPNQYEAGSAMGRRIQDQESLLEVGWDIINQLEIDALLITRGADGMSLFQKGGSFHHFPTVARKVYDVTGAGDTVIGAFTLALCAGATMAEAAHLANHAAGIVIREVGTACATPAKLLESFRDEEEQSEDR
jgi:rfaE bifunctional protein kinase chain/domain